MKLFILFVPLIFILFNCGGGDSASNLNDLEETVRAVNCTSLIFSDMKSKLHSYGGDVISIARNYEENTKVKDDIKHLEHELKFLDKLTDDESDKSKKMIASRCSSAKEDALDLINSIRTAKKTNK